MKRGWKRNLARVSLTLSMAVLLGLVILTYSTVRANAYHPHYDGSGIALALGIYDLYNDHRAYKRHRKYYRRNYRPYRKSYRRHYNRRNYNYRPYKYNRLNVNPYAYDRFYGRRGNNRRRH